VSCRIHLRYFWSKQSTLRSVDVGHGLRTRKLRPLYVDHAIHRAWNDSVFEAHASFLWTLISLTTLTLVSGGLCLCQPAVLQDLCHFPTTPGNSRPGRIWRALGQYQSCCLMVMWMICSSLIRPHPGLDPEWLTIREVKKPATVGVDTGSSRILLRHLLGLAFSNPLPSPVDLPEDDPNDHHFVERTISCRVPSAAHPGGLPRLIPPTEDYPLLDRLTTKKTVAKERNLFST